MATRGKAPFRKRQKEIARKDKQQRKAERRAQRKLDHTDSGHGPSEDVDSSSEAESKPSSEADRPHPFSGIRSQNSGSEQPRKDGTGGKIAFSILRKD